MRLWGRREGEGSDGVQVDLHSGRAGVILCLGGASARRGEAAFCQTWSLWTLAWYGMAQKGLWMRSAPTVPPDHTSRRLLI